MVQSVGTYLAMPICFRSGGDSVTYRCPRRFVLVGDFASAACYRGRWVPSMSEPGAPVCASRGCSWEGNGDATMLIGEINLGGAVVQFKCAPGMFGPSHPRHHHDKSLISSF